MSTPTSNPYATPAAPLGEAEAAAARSRLLLVAAWGTVLLLAGLAAAAIVFLNDIAATLLGISNELPQAAGMLYHLRHAWTAFPALALLLAAHAQSRPAHTRSYRVRMALALAGLLLLAMLCAVYVFLECATTVMYAG